MRDGEGFVPNAALQSFATGERIFDVKRSAHLPLWAMTTASNGSLSADHVPSGFLKTPPLGATQRSWRTSTPSAMKSGSAPRPSVSDPTNLPSHGLKTPVETQS